ncbi:MAG: hypothetical protein V3U92_00925 [Cellulophaga sp.]
MKNTLILIWLLFSTSLLFSQVSEDMLVNIHSVSNIEMNNLSPSTGSLVFNTDYETVYVFDGSTWKKLNNNLSNTYETVSLSQGNQTISVRDADKIVGFTLISNSNWLANNSGRMSGTWMLGENRERIRCYIQTLEHPYVKFLVVSVLINDSANEIVFTNYSSRYWTITNTTPQNNLSNNQNSYRLGKIVIIRKE